MPFGVPCLATKSECSQNRRQRYRTKDLVVELFDAKATEIKAMFNNTLEPARTTELREKMLRAGLPI